MTQLSQAHQEEPPLATSAATVERWLSTLRHVRADGIEAWVNDRWRVLAGAPPDSWSTEDIELAVTLIRPARVELAEFVDSEALNADTWKAFIGKSKSIVGEGLTLPDVWFSIGMAIDDEGTSAHWSWTAIALTPTRALLCERSDSYGSPAFPHPFGVITREHLFRSAALLMARRAEKREYFTAPRFLHEIHSSGIPDTEVYRILAAASGHGGDALIHLDPTELKSFRAPDMRYGFEDVLKRLDAWVDPA